jgi:diacylglycerol kinase family enzyme
MAKKIGIVLNPRSRHLRRHPASIGRLHLMVGDRGLVAESKDLDHIKRVGEDFLAAGVEVIGIAGGDGTAGITIKAFDEVYRQAGIPLPPFALLRGGTMNTVSNALHLPRGTPEKNLARLLAATSDDTPPPVIACQTLVADGRVGFLFGTGVFQSFLREYYRRGNNDPSAITAAETIGAMAASALVQGPLIRKLARPDTLALEVDGQPFPPSPYMAVTAGTVEQVGLGFSPFYLADRVRGSFHLLAIHGTPSTVVRDLPRVWLGRPIAPHNGMNLVAKRAVLTPTAGSVDYMVDGDLYTCRGPLVVEAGPAVSILRIPAR